MQYLLILFISIPIIEIAVFIQAGGLLGTPLTLLLIFVTAIIGVLLIRQQGLETLLRAQQKMQTGEIPAIEMFEGLLLAVAGLLLLTPGFFTDGVGFLLLIPPLRKYLILRLIKFRPMETHYYPGDQANRTIEGDYFEPDKKD